MKSLTGFAFLLFWITGFTQSREDTPLFQANEPVAIHLSLSIRGIKKITNDTIYTPSWLSYKNGNGNWDSLHVEVRARGNFRRKYCSMPPLKIKLKKDASTGTLFSGNKDLKLVLPCETTPNHNELIMKEYLCYQLYEIITPFNFNTRLVDLSLTDFGGRSTKEHSLKGFLIEDDDLIAKRFKGRMLDNVKIHPTLLHDTSAVVQAFFEYMIGNTDWSSLAQHNVKVLLLNQKKYIPLAYDFDMSGLVNAPYSTVNETLEIKNVRERLYRGFCQDESVVRYVQAEYVRLESQIMAVVDQFKNDIDPKELAGIKKYLAEFFDTLKNERAFKTYILQKCREKK
jgi:hypothetical protein